MDTMLVLARLSRGRISSEGLITDIPLSSPTRSSRLSTELSTRRACLGRLFFKVPGGIASGQHWLNVKYVNSTLCVPLRILTRDEEKLLNKNFESITKQVDEASRQKKK
jgi:hypothetical protein